MSRIADEDENQDDGSWKIFGTSRKGRGGIEPVMAGKFKPLRWLSAAVLRHFDTQPVRSKDQ
jgi:hypothetical protein